MVSLHKWVEVAASLGDRPAIQAMIWPTRYTIILPSKSLKFLSLQDLHYCAETIRLKVPQQAFLEFKASNKLKAVGYAYLRSLNSSSVIPNCSRISRNNQPPISAFP